MMYLKKCMVCSKDFLASDSKRQNKGKGTRMRTAVTCSHQCSRIYNRIAHHVWHKGEEKK